MNQWSVRFLFAFALALAGCTTTAGKLNSNYFRANIPIVEQDPSQLYGELFEQIQLQAIFSDSKHFVDMIPRDEPTLIVREFKKANPRSPNELREFVNRHFLPPADPVSNFKSQPNEPIDQHIKKLWKVLTRNPNEEQVPGSSLIPLPHSYVVPGGRFREIYYWDSYFTQLGLLADGEDQLFQDMVKNFEHLLLTAGKIPNGNRDYYRGRSQPPFFSHMVALWKNKIGIQSATQFIAALKIEHDFWMKGAKDLKAGEAGLRVVRLEENGYLNRYWDDEPAPRPEAYKEDIALAKRAAELLNRQSKDVYRDLRAGAESGWDYSTRWFSVPAEFATIQTTSFIPVDLNSLLYHLESTLTSLSHAKGDGKNAEHYKALAERRAQLIQKYLWDQTTKNFCDYNWRAKAPSGEKTVAMVVPLFVGVASLEQARQTAQTLEAQFLKPGGLITTLRKSKQQWDAPNGWPPHQWMAYAGLRRYKLDALAERIRLRWLKLNRKVYRSTGKMMEKYNVINLNLKSGGGEYPLQDGFGWTNGVYRALSTTETSLQHIY